LNCHGQGISSRDGIRRSEDGELAQWAGLRQHELIDEVMLGAGNPVVRIGIKPNVVIRPGNYAQAGFARRVRGIGQRVDSYAP
jgi:hypothetical protein